MSFAGFDPANPDKLGIGLKTRAREYEASAEAQGRERGRQNGQLVSFGGLGPLKDPMWQGLFQAMQEQGVDKTRYESGAGQNLIDVKPMQGGYSQKTFGPTPYTGLRESKAAMGGLQQAGPEGPDLKQKRVNSQAANRKSTSARADFYGRGR